MKKYLKLFVLMLPLLLLAGCKSEAEVTGQVFVVTNGRDNIKLGLVRVRAIEEERIQDHVNGQRAKADPDRFQFSDLFLMFAQEEATTDADGKFTMRLPAKGKYAFVAESSRQTLSGEEKYHWVVWANLADKGSVNVTLSNDNMIDVDPSDGTADVFYLTLARNF